MRKTVWVLVVLLAIVHFDFWFWDDRTLLFGFLPVGLGFHAGFSIACGVVWLMAVKFCWPADVEAWASGDEPPPTPATQTDLPRGDDPFADVGGRS